MFYQKMWMDMCEKKCGWTSTLVLCSTSNNID